MPVLNLSNRTGWDELQVTDMLAGELQSLPEFAVIPVDRVLATLASRGQDHARTAAEVRQVGRELGADWVLLAAVTEFDPYDPPRVGLTLQGYRTAWNIVEGGRLDPVAASRLAVDSPPAAAEEEADAPCLQSQVVLDAATQETRERLKDYASRRVGYESPFGWRVHAKSQQLFLRFSCHEAIQSIRQEIGASYRSYAGRLVRRNGESSR